MEYTLAVARKHLKRAIKDTDKNNWNYTEEEVRRLKTELRTVNEKITNTQRELKNGFGYETVIESGWYDPDEIPVRPVIDPESDIDLGDTESGGDDGIHSESVEPEESGESESSETPKVLL